MGSRDDDSIRGRSRVRYGPIVRAGTALAEIYAICGRDHWYALLARGLRLFHRGDLFGNLSLWLEPGFSRAALAGWNSGCRERCSVRRVRRVGKLLDECADRVWRVND